MRKNYDLFINRPLVFLCGPRIEDKTTDRRTIISSYISSLSRRNEEGKIFFNLVPIIVDDLFDTNIMKRESLSYKIMEEIVSSISFKTYILLDTMSTSYEYGLFDNSMVENSVTALLENDFLERTSCPIGEYIRLSHKNVDFIKYPAKKDKDNHLNFNKNKLPKTIEKKIIQDEEIIFDSLKNGINFDFKKNENGPSESLGEIQFTYDSESNVVHFNIDIKTFFYFSINCFRWKDLKYYVDKHMYNKALSVVKKTMSSFLIASKDAIPDVLKARLLVTNPKVTIKVGSFSDSKTLLKHILNLSLMINLHMEKETISGKFLKVGSILKPNLEYLKVPHFDFYKSFFGLSNIEFKRLNNYRGDKSIAINKSMLKISGKLRRIISYKKTRNGRELREIHEKITRAFYSTFTPAASSYAYHKDFSSIKACSQHLGCKHFYKMDIHAFFNSIDFNLLSKKIVRRLRSNTPAGMKRIVPNERFLRKYLQCCFLRKELPLGFVSSPILSDIYLNELDVKIVKYFKNVIYTRYADDILISSFSFTKELDRCRKFINKELKESKLRINNKKKANIIFHNYGDSIHFLGINIVFREELNELTISKKKIIDYAYRIIGLRKTNQYEKIDGIKQYVRNVSEKNYKTLNRIISIKDGSIGQENIFADFELPF